MIDPKTIENIRKFENVRYYTKSSFSYESLFDLTPNNDTRVYLNFQLEMIIRSITNKVNVFKRKNFFNDPSFYKHIPEQADSGIYSFCNDLKILNNEIKDYFDQWIKKFNLDNVEQFDLVLESVKNKLDSFSAVLKPILDIAVELDELNDNAALYNKLIPYYTYLQENPTVDSHDSFYNFRFILSDRDFSSIISKPHIETLKNDRQKVDYLMDLTKKNMEEIVHNNPSVFNPKFNVNTKKLVEQGSVAVDFFNACKTELISIFKEFKGDEALSKAELYKRHFESNGVVDFLKSKQIDEDFIDYSIDFGENVKLNKVIVFKDKSIGYVKHGEYSFVEMGDINTLESMHAECLESFISQQLHRKPTIRNLFLNKFREDQPSGNQLILVLQNYLDNEQILKNMNLHLDIFKNKSFENIDDAMSASVRKYKAERMVTSVLGNKYDHLYSENKDAVINICIDLVDLQIDKSSLQDFVGKKLAAISNSDEFINVLKKLKNSLNEFDQESLFYKLEKIDIKPLEVEPNVFVFEIKNYQTCKDLGSASWCIVRDEEYFDDYTSEGDRQYFIYDFNKDSSDIESMMGFTLHKNGSLRTQHYKNDDYIDDSYILDKAQLTVLSSDNSYKLNDSLKLKLTDFSRQKNRNINNHFNV